MKSATTLALLLYSLSFLSSAAHAAEPANITATRLGDAPIITPEMDARMGGNIQGPSLIKVPDWIENPLGNYYLYFADHRGTYIRMAYANEVTGPWTVYSRGSLRIEDSFFPTTCPPCSLAPGQSASLYAHIASPDVHVREDLQQIVMYYHGRGEGRQFTRAAVSQDGIHFEGREDELGPHYFRVIKHDDYFYAMSMPGFLHRSPDGLSKFEAGPGFFNADMRHSALLIRDDHLYIFFSQAGEQPERILLSTIELTDDWREWTATDPVEVLRPEFDYEGANMPNEPSRRGFIDVRVNQLRDPAIYQEDDKTYLLYSVAGESGIAIAEISFANAQTQTTLSPTEHCRDFSEDAIVTFADQDLAEVVNGALGLDAGAALSCGQAASLEQLIVGTTIERVVYGGTLRPSPENPFESLDGIQNLTGLTRLTLLNRLITDISPLGSLTNLVNLNLHTNWFSDLSPISGLTNLEQLIVSENPISDISPLAGLTKLRQLHVHGLYPYQLQHYLNMNDGRDPNVVFSGITDISPLAGLTEIRLLRIHLNAISDISPLANLTKLTHLRIYDSQIKDISALANLDDLVLLWAHNNQIEDISPLSGMTGMQQLSLNDNAISDIGALSDMIDLEHLFLSNNKIEDIGPLRRLHALKVLRLENNNITDVSALAGLSQLGELSLARNWSLYNVQPLLLNSGLGESDELDLRFTHVRCSDMDAFARLGVDLLRVTAINGSACPGRRLEDP